MLSSYYVNILLNVPVAIDIKIGLLRGEREKYANADGETDIRKVKNKTKKKKKNL